MGLTHTWPTKLAPALIVAVAVYAACLFGVSTRPPGLLATLWPANAILLGMLIRFPRANNPLGWVAAFAAYMAVDLLTGSSLDKALLLNLTNLLGVSVGAVICHRLQPDVRKLHHPMAVLAVVGVSVVAAGAAGLGGALVDPILFGGTPLGGWVLWFTTELVNYITFLPAILALPGKWDHHALDSIRRHPAPVLTVIATTIIAHLVGGPGAIAFAAPALFWCGLVYNVFTNAVITLILACWMLYAIASGYLPILAPTDNHLALISVRLGVSLISLAPLMLAAVTAGRNELLSRLYTMATYDGLTSVLNRKAFMSEAELRLHTQVATTAVLMIDLDNFKAINDQFGHEAGDGILIQFARKVEACLTSDDLFGRLGGEEFAVMLTRPDAASAAAVAERIRYDLSSSALTLPGGQTAHISASIGLACAARQGFRIETYLREADAALYLAKSYGRNRVIRASWPRTDIRLDLIAQARRA
jgi:diguanylate cyclase (GGDEF)-like protein